MKTKQQTRIMITLALVPIIIYPFVPLTGTLIVIALLGWSAWQ